MTLAKQFALAGGTVFFAAALAVGNVVANRIEKVVVQNSAATTALYIESYVGPLTRQLTERETLSSRTDKSLAEVLAQTPTGKRVVSFKVWRPGGLVIDASNADLIGQRFEVADIQQRAWDGLVSGDFEDTDDAEDEAEDALDMPFLETYVPVWHPNNGQVIAVVEFYEMAQDLKQNIRVARTQTWVWLVGVLFLIGAALYLIVLRGSRTIEAQLVALRDLSERNVALRVQIQGAAARSATLAERTLRQIGADLHDGPAQLMAFAALRIDAMKARVETDHDRAELTEVGAAVGEAILDIRNLSRGLSVPDLDKREMTEIVQDLVHAHAARTGTEVSFTRPDGDLPVLSSALRLCIYRFVQEGLNNSWRHAGGIGQELRISCSAGMLQFSVLDRGPGFPTGLSISGGEDAQHLGLAGLMDRVVALGGRLEFIDRDRESDGSGAELRMTITVKP